MSSSIFIDLADEDQEVATSIVERCRRHAVAAGTVRAGDAFREGKFVVVEQGLALVERPPTASSRPVVVTLAGPGRIVLPPAANEQLRALTDVSVSVLTSAAVDGLLAIPRVASVLVERLAEELRQSHETLALAGSIHHVDRIRAKLLQLARSHGKVVGGGVRLDLSLTHDLLAHMLGSSRGTVTRTLASLESEGFLRRDRRSLILVVPPDDLA